MLIDHFCFSFFEMTFGLLPFPYWFQDFLYILDPNFLSVMRLFLFLCDKEIFCDKKYYHTIFTSKIFKG